MSIVSSQEIAARFNPKVAEALREYTRRSPFAAHLGIEIIDFGPGWTTGQLRIQAHHTSGVGAVHGGAIVSLIDHVLSLAVYPLVEVGKWVATLEFKVSYLAPVRDGATITARGEVVSLRKRLGSVKVDVRDEKDLVASALGTVYIREKLG